MSALFEDLAWPEIEAAVRRGAGVVVPIGAVEQHGPHMPVLTDSLLARDFVVEAVMDRDYLVAPSLPFGYRSRPATGGGPEFVGTMSLSATTLIAVIREMLEELMRMGFKKLAVYVWHMENRNLVYEAAHLAVGAKTDCRVMVMEEPFESFSEECMQTLFGDDFPGWPAEHAGIMETSIMLFRHGARVDMSKAVNDFVPRTPGYEVVPTPPDMRSETGVHWNATEADAHKGEVAFREIIEFVRTALDAEFPELAQ